MNRSVYILLVVGLVAVLAWSFSPMRNGHHQHAEVSSSGSAPGAPIVNVEVPELTGPASLGQTAFNDNCAVCHGANAAGQEGIAPPLIHKIYEPSHHGDQSFVLAVQQGVRQHHWPFGNMPPVVGVSDRDIENIINYVRTVQRANGIN